MIVFSLLKGVSKSRTGWLTHTVAVQSECCGNFNSNVVALPLSILNFGLCDTKCYSSFTHDKTRDPYQVLGLHSLATKKEVKDAYIRLSKLCHPDRNPDNADAAAEFNEIREAYEHLIAKLDSKDVSTDPQDNTYQDEFHTGSYGQPPFRSQRRARNVDDWVRNIERNARMREQEERRARENHFKFHDQQHREERNTSARYDKFESSFIRNLDKGIKFHQVRDQLESEFDKRLIQRVSSKAPILYLVFVKALIVYGGRTLMMLALLLFILDCSYED